MRVPDAIVLSRSALHATTGDSQQRPDDVVHRTIFDFELIFYTPATSREFDTAPSAVHRRFPPVGGLPLTGLRTTRQSFTDRTSHPQTFSRIGLTQSATQLYADDRPRSTSIRGAQSAIGSIVCLPAILIHVDNRPHLVPSSSSQIPTLQRVHSISPLYGHFGLCLAVSSVGFRCCLRGRIALSA